MLTIALHASTHCPILSLQRWHLPLVNLHRHVPLVLPDKLQLT